MTPANSSETKGKVKEPTSEDQVLTEQYANNGIVLDIDRNVVRATLFDTVEGHGRFITGVAMRSTAGPPINDISISVRNALQVIEQESGRFLLSGNLVQTPAEGYTGVDQICLTGQPVGPTRLAIVPTGTHQLTETLVAVARTTATEVRLLKESIRTDDGVLSGSLLEQALQAFIPDVIVLLAGNKTQTEWPTAIGKLQDLVNDQQSPHIVVLASEQLQQHAIQHLGENATLSGLDPHLYELEDVSGAIEIELNNTYEERLRSVDFGLARNVRPFIGRGRAIDLVSRFVARRRDQTIIAADIGDGTTVHQAGPAAGSLVLRPDVDLQRNISAALGLDLERVIAQLPFDLSTEDLRHWILNRALRPELVADLERDQFVESVLACELVRSVWSDLPRETRVDAELIIGGPTFAGWNHPTLGILSLLNAFAPAPACGVVEIALDADGIAAAAGAIGELNPSLAADAVEHDLLVDAVSVIVVEGEGVRGALSVRGQLTTGDGEVQQVSVPYGAIRRLPFPKDDAASLTLTCEPGFSIGSVGAGEQIQFGDEWPLCSGPLGVIVDARGRERDDDSDLARRQGSVRSWFRDLGILE